MLLTFLAYYISFYSLGKYIFSPKSSSWLQIEGNSWNFYLGMLDGNTTIPSVCDVEEHYDEYDDTYWHTLPEQPFEWLAYSPNDCAWSFNTAYDDHGSKPLLLHKQNNSAFLPHKANNYWIPHSYEFLIGCPTSSFVNGRFNNYVKAGGSVVSPFLKVRCEVKRIRDPLSLNLDIKKYGCKSPLKTVVKQRGTCGTRPNEGVQYIVGYEVLEKDSQLRVVPEYFVCFDRASSTPYYTTHMIFWSRLIDYQRRPADRPTFDIFDVRNAYEVFALPNQKNFFISKFHTAKYINPAKLKGDQFFSKGHMVPDADKASLSGMATTYNFVNVVPQYHTNNKGNWKIIEENIRQLSSRRKLDLKIFTGTHGGIFVKDPTKNRLVGPVYLGDSKLASKGKFKIPKFMYKIVYDPKNLRAAVVVMINDPFGSRNDFSDLFGVNRLPCKPRVPWISLNLPGALDDSKPEFVFNGLICVVEYKTLAPVIPVMPILLMV